MAGDGILVIDAGTSGVRAALVDREARVLAERRREVAPATPGPGRVELDAESLAAAALEVAREVLAAGGPARALGITNQRASTVLWDRETGSPLGPALGWQDLRTRQRCAELQGAGIFLLPNQSATKLEALLDLHDPERRRDLCFGTVDSWLAWRLSEGRLHVTDATNAAATGLFQAGAPAAPVLERLRIPPRMLPRVVDSSGMVGEARALPGAPPIAGLIGDQQASLLGQGCVEAGQTKITFGTGAMLDMMLGEEPPPGSGLGPSGTFPIVAWRLAGATAWGLEGNVLAAGACIAWLRDGLGLLGSADESHAVAQGCTDCGGVVFVPALLGLGTPWWDLRARGAFLGLTRGSHRSQLVRAVLEGVAQRAADLVEAAEADSGRSLERLRVDGGMTGNPTFLQALADACQRPIQVAQVREATALGAAFLAGLAVGTWADLAEVAATYRPGAELVPRRCLDRARWREAVNRVRESAALV